MNTPTLFQVLTEGNDAGGLGIANAASAQLVQAGVYDLNLGPIVSVTADSATNPVGLELIDSNVGCVAIDFSDSTGDCWTLQPNSSGTFEVFSQAVGSAMLTFDSVNGSISIGPSAVLQLGDYAVVGLPSEGMVAWDFSGHAMRIFNGTSWLTVTAS
jgi:hypothetical protein